MLDIDPKDLLEVAAADDPRPLTGSAVPGRYPPEYRMLAFGEWGLVVSLVEDLRPAPPSAAI
jgi:hypothetical protein